MLNDPKLSSNVGEELVQIMEREKAEPKDKKAWISSFKSGQTVSCLFVRCLNEVIREIRLMWKT